MWLLAQLPTIIMVWVLVTVRVLLVWKVNAL